LLSESGWFTVLFTLVYWVYYERIMFAEEQFLRKKFGPVYLDWAAKTPAFVPSLKHRTPSKMAFSWKKILKKEKNGFFAIFLVFYLFQCTDNLMNNDKIISLNWLFHLTFFSGILYLILKILKRTTRLLDEANR
jgi:hypothetical protein